MCRYVWIKRNTSVPMEQVASPGPQSEAVSLSLLASSTFSSFGILDCFHESAFQDKQNVLLKLHFYTINCMNGLDSSRIGFPKDNIALCRLRNDLKNTRPGIPCRNGSKRRRVGSMRLTMILAAPIRCTCVNGTTSWAILRRNATSISFSFSVSAILTAEHRGGLVTRKCKVLYLTKCFVAAAR